MKLFNRAAIYKNLPVAVFVLSLGFMSAGLAQAIELKLAHFMSPKHPYHESVFNWLGTKLADETDGELTIRVYPGGELGPGPAEQFNRAVDGVADITFFIPGYTAAKFPKSLIMETPGLLQDDSLGPRGFVNALDDIADEYRRVKLLALWNIAPSALFTRNKAVHNLSDLQGLKIRVASKTGGALVEAWGATAVFMPVTEMYTAIQTGIVDGSLIDGGAALAHKLMEVCNFVTIGMDSTVTIFGLAMNRDSYDNLSDAHRAALDKYTGLGLSQRAWTSWNGMAAKSYKIMGSMEGKQVILLSADAAIPFNEKAAEVRENYFNELESEGIAARVIAAKMAGE